MHLLVFALATVLGLNIGASGAGAAMAAAHASGALPRRHLLALFATCAVTGALLGGRRVIATLSTTLVPPDAFTYPTVLAVAGAAALALVVANTFRVPQSTTQVTVAAIAGVGLAHGALSAPTLVRIVAAWTVNPLLAFCLCYAAGRWLYPPLDRQLAVMGRRGRQIQQVLVLGASCYMALGVGMNNVGNAMAAVVGGGFLDLTAGALCGGLLMGVGGLTLGRRIVSTTGQEITGLCLLKGAMVCVVTATLTVAASQLGLPTSYVQTSTLAVLGVSASHQPLWQLLGQRVVRRIGLMWLASPTVAFVTGFWLVGGSV